MIYYWDILIYITNYDRDKMGVDKDACTKRLLGILPASIVGNIANIFP